MNFVRGQIVIVSRMFDPRGRNPKDRRCVVVDPIDPADRVPTLVVVAISTTLPDPLPDFCVPLPWQLPRHPATGLTARCAAVCNWVAEVDASRILRLAGVVPSKPMAAILARLGR